MTAFLPFCGQLTPRSSGRVPSPRAASAAACTPLETERHPAVHNPARVLAPESAAGADAFLSGTRGGERTLWIVLEQFRIEEGPDRIHTVDEDARLVSALRARGYRVEIGPGGGRELGALALRPATP